MGSCGRGLRKGIERLPDACADDGEKVSAVGVRIFASDIVLTVLGVEIESPPFLGLLLCSILSLDGEGRFAGTLGLM